MGVNHGRGKVLSVTEERRVVPRVTPQSFLNRVEDGRPSDVTDTLVTSFLQFLCLKTDSGLDTV